MGVKGIKGILSLESELTRKVPKVEAVASSFQVCRRREWGCDIYYEWYCPVCREIHWDIAYGFNYPLDESAFFVSLRLGCSDLYLWMTSNSLALADGKKSPKLSESSVLGIPRKEFEKSYPTGFGKPQIMVNIR